MRLFGVLSSGLALTGRANQGISGVCVNTSSTSLNSSIGIECDELAILMQTDALAKAKKNEYEEIMNNLNLPKPKLMDINVPRNIKLGA